MLPGLDHRSLVDALVPSVLAAGRLQLAYFRTDIAVERKADASPVTAADRESEALIVSALERIAPGAIVAAEEAIAEGRVPPVVEEMFLVDPLDGTRDFVAGTEDFTVNIGFVSRGRAVFGLILVPARGEIYATFGPRAAGTARVDMSDTELASSDLKWTPITVREQPAAGLVAVASPWRPQEQIDAWLASERVDRKVYAGSSYKFCLVARGDGDVYAQLGATHEWDTAAGQAIVEAAGGTVVTRDGSPLVYGKAGSGYLNPPFMAWGARRAAADD